MKKQVLLGVGMALIMSHAIAQTTSVSEGVPATDLPQTPQNIPNTVNPPQSHAKLPVVNQKPDANVTQEAPCPCAKAHENGGAGQ